MSCRFYRLLWTGLAAVLLLPFSARAVISINAQSFHPTLGPENGITIEGTRTPGKWMPMGSFGFDWGYRSVRNVAVDMLSGDYLSDKTETLPHIVTLHLMAGLGFTDWFSLGVELPIVAYQQFNLNDFGLASGLSNYGAGDFRVMAKFRLKNNTDGGFGVAFVPQITFPSGNGQQLTGTDAVGFDLRFALDYKFRGGAFVAMNLGFFARTSDQKIGSTVASHEIRYGIAGYVPFGKTGIGALLEFTGGTSVANIQQFVYSPFEMNAAARYNHRSGFMAALGFGLGLSPAPGSPQFRLFASVGYEKMRVKEAPKPLPQPPQPGDRDGDTVFDHVDDCPDEAGPVENKGCPVREVDGDRDRDTVLDKVDGCPDVAGPVENKGCPWPDRDSDGVLDKDDRCPDVPGPRENQGCPETRKFVRVENDRIELLQQILFATNKAVIKPASFPLLDEIVSVLNSRPTMTIHIGGHTDERGNPAWNLKLSKMRADSVMAYLVKKGIQASRLTAQGYGSTQDARGVDALRAQLAEAKAAGKKALVRKIQKLIHDANRRTEFLITAQ